MIFQNLHTHTVFGDGKNTPEEMVQGAVRAGLRSLGFSEHSPMPPASGQDDYTMALEDVPAYRNEVLRLRGAYAGQLDIYLGLEQDIDSPPPGEGYDYLIGSVHGVWKDGVYLPVDESREVFIRAVREFYGGDFYAFARDYYQRAAGVYEKTGCQIIGHFDLISKFNEGGGLFDEGDSRYRAAALGALDVLLGKDVIFEINTGAMSRGYRTAPYPAPFLLQRICEKGGKICITSDSHSADTVTCAFPQAAELARECGFREAAVLEGEKFRFQALMPFQGI